MAATRRKERGGHGIGEVDFLLMISYGWMRYISCTMHSNGPHLVWIGLDGSIEHQDILSGCQPSDFRTIAGKGHDITLHDAALEDLPLI